MTDATPHAIWGDEHEYECEVTATFRFWTTAEDEDEARDYAEDEVESQINPIAVMGSLEVEVGEVTRMAERSTTSTETTTNEITKEITK
jgi:hypothetical protein